ncbi:MAG: pyruvate kinase [Halobacteriales archaeon]
MRNAKIVCTLGPASYDRETILGLAEAGMTVTRINASHGERDDRRDLIDRTRQVDHTVEKPVATMLDLQGPEVRTASVDEPVHLETGAEVRFVEGETATPEEIGLSVGIMEVEAGDKVLLDDGRIETSVERVLGDTVIAHVDAGGDLGSRKGVNVPGVDLRLDVVTEKDGRDLALAVEKEVDFVAASFVRDGDDVLTVSEVIEDHGGDIPIIAKIERADAVENLDSIVDTAYGVMVARGDLGVECPLEDVPLVQKRIIRKCQNAGVPVITATEMLDSMIDQRRPTRAETSDVANAVLDGTDAVMLSGETAIGDHPVRVVETMDRIIREIEGSIEHDELIEQRVPPSEGASTDATARSARYLARDVDADAIVVASETGYTALKTSKFRPGVPIVAATPTDQVRRQLAVSWGVNAQYADLGTEGPAGVIENAVSAALDSRLVDSGDTVIVLSGMMTGVERSTTNTLKVHVAAETLGIGRGVVSGQAVGPISRAPSGDLSGIPEGAILALDADFDGEFESDTGRIGGIIHARTGITGYPAIVAREIGVPMASGIDINGVDAGKTVTLDGDRGVVYAGDVRHSEGTRERQ